MKKPRILIIVSIVIILILAIGGGVWWWKKEQSPPNSPQKPEKPNNNSQKDLINEIKTDLQVRLERVKNGSRELEDIMPYIIDGNPKRTIMCNVDGLKFIKWGESISFDDIGEENAQSIISLVKQIRTVKEEWKEKMKQKAQAKADANPDLFYFPARGSFVGGILTDEITHFQFYSRQDKKDYRLTIPVLHPDLANIQIKSEDWNLYRITGVENIPLVPCPIKTVKVPYKIFKLSDHFTIEKIDF